MEKLGAFSEIRNHRVPDNAHAHEIERQARGWDKMVRRELSSFARALWPEGHELRWPGSHSYRLRKQSEPNRFIWWVERDIPPQDRYRCAAYRVELSGNGQGHNTLIVQSGEGEYPVVPADESGLEVALIQASQDDPLIIPRRMGAALDP